MRSLTWAEWSTLVGSLMLWGTAVLDLAFMHQLGTTLDVSFIATGTGALLGTGVSFAARPAA